MPDINQNLIGKQFGHLTVIAKSDQRGTQNEYKWVCQPIVLVSIYVGNGAF